MSGEHYFSERPSAEGGRRSFVADLRGFEVRLVTAAGVFSRERVDRGTRLMVRHMEVGPADRVLDLGCGYGVVGIVAAMLAPQGRVVLVDVNERAVALARANLRLNRVENASALRGDGFAPVGAEVFDVVALNPPIRAGLAVVHRLIEESKAHLVTGGHFYLVGRTKQGVARIAQKMSAVLGSVEEVAKGGGFRLYLALRQAE